MNDERTTPRPVEHREDPEEPPSIAIDRANPSDIETIGELIANAVPDCVPQTPEQIGARIDEFRVGRADGGTVIACAALSVLHPSVRELRGVAVSRDWRGRGVGTTLIEQLATECTSAGDALVCVTRRPSYFSRLGFQRIAANGILERLDRPVVEDGRPRVLMQLCKMRPMGGVEPLPETLAKVA